ncbi:MAG: PLP-dependent aminotransferase family protein [Granulosicoccus sp.]
MVSLASRIQGLGSSPIRDILKMIDQPGMISLAGGLPDTHCFPELHIDVETQLMQYGASEGEENLRQWIANDLAARGIETDANCVIILSGSQQGIDLSAKLLIEPGTPVAVESPTYLAALQVFKLFGARLLDYDSSQFIQTDESFAPTLLYTIPTFQNPTGKAYDSATRQQIARQCDARGTVLFEDDPYRELSYEPCDRKPICAMVESAPWIYQSSFSKTLCPGLRLGYLACSASLYPYLLQLKQAADLHSNRIAQAAVYSLVNSPDYHTRLSRLCELYREKRDHFDSLLDHYFYDIAQWDIPQGGLFFWLRLKTEQPVDTRTWLPDALAANIAFMPGEPFFSDGRSAASTIRLNFTYANNEEMEKGIASLAQIIRKKINACS